MRPTPILLMFFVMLSFAREAVAWSSIPVTNRDYTLKIAGRQFGFADGWTIHQEFPKTLWSKAYLGPIGQWEVPFSATQGLVGFCLIVIGLLALATMLTFRLKRKRPA